MKKKHKGIGYYVAAFKKLKCGRLRGQVAPHKAIMLLTVIDEIANATITNGFVPHNDAMVEAYLRMWKKHIGFSKDFRPNFATAFSQLASDTFWIMMKTEQWTDKSEYTLRQLRKCFFGAKIADDLWEHMLDTQSRRQLIAAILERYILSTSSRQTAVESPMLFDFNDPNCQLSL